MESKSILNVIEGDYGLLSLDPACISTLLYVKLKNIPVEIKLQNTLKSCALYSVPTLLSEGKALTKFTEMVQYWKRIHLDTEDGLNAKESSETLALMNLVSSKLSPVLEFLYWVDQRNCDEFTSRWFMKALPFPFNYSYVKKKRQAALELMESLYPLDSDLEVVKEFVTKTATQCLATLSLRLNKSNFFYGDQPTLLDVLVYAHVAPLMKLPFVSSDICALVSMWPNLVEFVKRIDAKYLADLRRDVKYLKDNSNLRQNDDEVSYVALAIMVVSATSLLVGFAVKKGFVTLPSLF